MEKVSYEDFGAVFPSIHMWGKCKSSNEQILVSAVTTNGEMNIKIVTD
jgi:hypothetical protein